MKPICSLSAISPNTDRTVNALVGLLNDLKAKFPETIIVGFSVCPEMQPPSIALPNGGMVYVGVAVVEMDSEESMTAFQQSVNQGDHSPNGMHRIK